MMLQIQQLSPSLSAAEKQVAEWVVAHPRELIDTTLANVARRVGVSEPSVIRFCRRLGLSGFRNLKLRMAEELARPSTYLHQAVSAGDSSGDAVRKVFDGSIQAMIDLRGRLADMPFDRAVADFIGARQWVFAGIGASGHVAADACHKFFRLATPTVCAEDSATLLQLAAIARPEDVFVFLSTSGQTAEVCRAAAAAGKRGARVVAVTAANSSLAECSDYCFVCETHEDASIYTPMSSRLAQLMILDALHTALALALGEPASLSLQRSKAVLANIRLPAE